EHGRHHFHTPIKITRHPVSRPDIELFVTAVCEVKNTTVFEELSHNIADVNRLRESGLAGADHARTTHDEIDLDACLRCFVKQFDHGQVGQTVNLGLYVRRPAGQRMFRLTLDQTHHAFAQVER